jgi:DNA-binding LacI/PurR family transcriptional regulator
MEIDSDTYFIEVDIADGVRQSIEHLYHRGKRRIGIVSMDDLYVATQSTFKAYHQTLNKYGLSDEPVLQSMISPGTSEDMKSEEIEKSISQIVLNGKADAILARNDFMALMAIKTLRSLKLRIPEDVAVIGSDKIPVCRMVDPMITSVDHNNEIVAAKAVEMVTHLIEGRSISEDQRQMVVKPTLVVRESA